MWVGVGRGLQPYIFVRLSREWPMDPTSKLKLHGMTCSGKELDTQVRDNLSVKVILYLISTSRLNF